MPIKFRKLIPLALLAALFMSFRITDPGKMGPGLHSDPAPSTPDISIVTDAASATAQHGLDKLTAALTEKHISYEKVSGPGQAKGKYLLIAGLADDNGPAANLLTAGHHPVAKTAGALTIWHTTWRQKPAIVIGGYDDTGLMYALLETAREIGIAGTPQTDNARAAFSVISDVTEKPALRDRAMSIYTMNRAYWESRFYDEKYWAKYLDMMAENRFNSLVVVFGYENGGFLAPCYPYFFNVDGYPDIRMVGLSDQEQQHNLSAIRKLIAMAHERGIRFTAGIWDHIYRGGVQGGGIPGSEKAPDHPTPGLVWGVTADNLTAYTKTALEQFIRQIPVDAIQFRMHGESGLKKEEEESFWADVFKMIRQIKPGLQIDMRAKELPRTVIESAINTGIKFRIATKFWMEQLGLPYHPTRINPDKSYIRHSYGDLLRYPKQYDLQWRLWNGGTNRILLWGDPEYARRFMGSAHLYDGDGFEVNEPLATKMEAQPHDARPFDLLLPQHRYYEYEFQRYWHLFQVFGRIGYNPHTADEVWDKEFTARFGPKTGPLIERALHRASGILPRIVASCYPYGSFPMTRGWAEKQRLGDLPAYAKAEGSDLCQFADFDDEARLLLEGGEEARIRPAANSQWFAHAAADVLGLIARVRSAEGTPDNKELASTIADLGIYANLALYHARRAPAAVYYRLYERTHDLAALDSAIAHERLATDAWRQIVVAAGDYYNDNLQMGVSVADLCGHWKDELTKLEAGLLKLEQQRLNADPKAMTSRAPVYTIAPSRTFEDLFRVAPTLSGVVSPQARAGQPVRIAITVSAPAGIRWVRLYYRAVNQQLEYRDIGMKPTGKPGEYAASIPAAEIDTTYDLMYYVALMDKTGNGRIWPDVEKETPYRIISLIRK
ncbi:MAG TPA: hypothetical protein VK563_17870 [Puia sp.]|nr:hypothetical protein [Puia sp.]